MRIENIIVTCFFFFCLFSLNIPREFSLRGLVKSMYWTLFRFRFVSGWFRVAFFQKVINHLCLLILYLFLAWRLESDASAPSVNIVCSFCFYFSCFCFANTHTHHYALVLVDLLFCSSCSSASSLGNRLFKSLTCINI